MIQVTYRMFGLQKLTKHLVVVKLSNIGLLRMITRHYREQDDPVRPSKISREELLQRCANTFKRLGYHGTTMDELSTACGLTKASFYHHYPNKDALLKDVLGWTHQRLKEVLFSLAYDHAIAPELRLENMGRKAKKLFQDDSIGCLMGVVAVDASYGRKELMEPIRAFLDDWIAAFSQLFEARDFSDAEQQAKQLVADFEGAILLARIYNDPSYIDRVTLRAVERLKPAS